MNEKYKESLENKYDLKIFTNNIEYRCLNQISELLSIDIFSKCKVRIMPDTHAGKGCVVGFTANLSDKVIPNLVGVDIGCGVLTVKLGNIDIDLDKLDNIIREKIPSGFSIHNKAITSFKALNDIICLQKLSKIQNFEKGLGTLGGGNHFIEIDKDENNNKYLVIHSGSRNLGAQVAQFYQNIAINKRPSNIPEHLAYLDNIDKEQYLNDMHICQEYAHTNRILMAGIILNELLGKSSYVLVDENEIDIKKAKKANISNTIPFIETIHNYISFKDNIIRKGAVSAYENEKLLIPINMRDGAILGKGKGNPNWNFSAPHGAGRLLSRSDAKQLIDLDDYIETMKGIYTTSVNNSTLDESPFVYKPLDEIIQNIKDTVEIETIIKPIYNFKAS